MMSPSALIAQLTSDLWAMEPNRLEALFSDLMRPCAFGLTAPTGEVPPYQVENGTARIPINGVMMKNVPWIFEYFGIEGASTTKTRAALRQALADADVKDIALDIDSPGGQVAGTQELAAEVFQARGQKPIAANVSDTAASAAYWVASQADSITANKAALVGSIGVYAVYYDTSEALASRGVKVQVVRSAPLKGIGVAGEELTDERLEAIQREVSALAALFVKDVAAGRDASVADIKKSATGEVWLADEAKSRGLIDQVGSVAAADPDEEEDEPEEDEPTDDTDEEEEEEDENEGEDTEETNALSGAQQKGAQMSTTKNAPDPSGATGESPDKIKIAALAAQVAGMRKIDCDRHIEAAAGAGRILPAARPHVEAYAKSVGFDATKVEAFLAEAFGDVRTNPDRASADPASENQDTSGVTEDETRAVKRMLGLSDEQSAAFAGVVSVTVDGRKLNAAGEEVKS